MLECWSCTSGALPFASSTQTGGYWDFAYLLGLVVSMWLLSVVGSPSDEVDLIGVALQMILLCVLHAVVLLFLMVAIEPRKLLDRDRARE